MKRFALLFAIVAAMLVVPSLVIASSVAESIVDTTAPVGSVTLAAGASGTITINLSVTGKQDGTATFDVYKTWTLSGGTFTGSDPETFTVPPRAAGDAATTFSRSGTVTVSAGQAAGSFTLAVGAFNITNSNSTGSKLGAGTSSSYAVTVASPADTTAPVITPNITGTLGDNGWYVSDVSVTWTVTDAESAITSTTGCGPTTIDTDTGGTLLTCSATSAGGTNNVPITIKRDATAPTISASGSPAPNGDGWNNTDVTVSFTCTDDLSGIPDGACPADQVLSTEGTGISSTAETVTDAAGNTSDLSNVVTVNIDKTAPTVNVTGVTEGATYVLGSVPAAGCSTSDALSGVAADAVLGLSGGPIIGSFTATCSGAEDEAGNTADDVTVHYSVTYNWTGFFSPINNVAVNSVKAGSAVPVKFSLGGNAGLSILNGAPTVTLAACTTSPTTTTLDTTTSGNSSLSYDPTTNQYTYVWKTDKAWAGKCGVLTVKLNDGTTHTANFQFAR